MHDRILELFAANPGNFISGERLSEQLECSRTAVWKHIERLRKQGYEFDAQPRKGYRLKSGPKKLDIHSILASISTDRFGKSIHYYERMDSTQTKAHELAANGAQEGTVVIAEEQLSGRGRMGRKWISPFGKGIWMSLILRPAIPLQFSPQLTLLISVALCRALKQMLALEIGIKWPNDLLIRGKKISGILLESSAEDERLKYVIAGIGISANLSADDFPEEMRDKTTSLLLESGNEVSREKLFTSFLEELEKLYNLFIEQGFAPIRLLWEALSVSLGKPVRLSVEGEMQEGNALAIDEYGALMVKLPNGDIHKLYSGEVELTTS